MSEPKLVVNGLAKRYRAGKVIFQGVSMHFSEGEAVLLSGPNGSGKTTFLRILSVNSWPSEGSVTYKGIDIHKKPHLYLADVGLVHDEESLPRYLSAVELLEWVMRSRTRRNDGVDSQAIGELLDRLELDEARYEEIGTYSTGMRKKAQIAAALVSKPSVLILDEPLRGLDRAATRHAMELFAEAAGRGAILLMASHEEHADESMFRRRLEFPLRGDRY